jgi:cytochrome P450
MHPPAPQLLSKEVPPSGDVLDGKFVPAGTYVGICARGVQRNKSIFGEDVEVYRPERWIEASGERLQRMEKTADLVFGHGRYHCLGSNVAMIEIRKVFTEVRFYRPLDVTQTH